MEKIKDLLKQLGATEELTESILNELKSFHTRTKKQLDEEFHARLEKAKQVCLEEFDKEKVKLSKKVEVFLESRANTIDREAQKQAAIGESESAKTLRDMKCLLEGVNIGDAAKDVQAVKEEANVLRHRLNQVMEEKDQLKAQAQRANDIAMKAINRNKILETTTRTTATKIDESKHLETQRTVSQKPKTQRKVLTENVAKEQPKKTPDFSADSDVAQIAATIDDSVPAYVS
jgi:hypothetical protein